MNPSSSPAERPCQESAVRSHLMTPEGSPPVVTVHQEAAHGATAIALELADLIQSKPQAVLGLATGQTMVGVYAALVREVRQRDLDISGIKTFNLDEFIGLGADDPRSFRSFMSVHLHGPLGFGKEAAMFPDEVLAATDGAEAARRFEDAIDAAGGVDVQLLGLGRNGHIGFNEPGSSAASRTRVVQLHGFTREDAAAGFGGIDATPSRAVTMGIATILGARALRVLAFGERKAEAVRQLLEGEEGPAVPCTFLRNHHANLAVHIDPDAGQLLQ